MAPDPQGPLSTPGFGTGSPCRGWRRAWGWREAQWVLQGWSQRTPGPGRSPEAETEAQSVHSPFLAGGMVKYERWTFSSLCVSMVS